MDVACGRCGTEYDFDDALISGQGTTVRCTSCGFQFKVFPPEGQASPEVWRLFPAQPGASEVVFDSLRDLQRAIARGEVGPHDALARGREEPRVVSSIVELEPLLRHPRSVPPPGAVRRPSSSAPASASEDEELRAAESKLPRDARVPREVEAIRAPTGTVMGIAAPKPREVGEAPPPLEAPESAPPLEDAGRVASRPRIQSALSVAPGQEGTPKSDRPSYVPPSASLRSTLSKSPSSGPRGPGAAAPESASSSRRQAHPEVHEPPTLPEMARKSPQPTIVQSDEIFRDHTPTPSDMRYSQVDSGPVSSLPGSTRRRGARSGWLVIAVLLGGGAFAFIMGRDKIAPPQVAPSPAPAAQVKEPGVAPEALPDVAKALDLAPASSAVRLADEAWLRTKLASADELAAAQAELEARLVVADQALSDVRAKRGEAPMSPEEIWLRIHQLRINGDAPVARNMLSQLSPEELNEPYGLGLLDLAAAKGDRPYPLILRRLKEAQTGERGDYQARTAYIFTLAEAGDLRGARADFEAFTKLTGSEAAPLYGALDAYLTRLEEGVPVNDAEASKEAAPKESAASTETAAPKEATAPKEPAAPKEAAAKPASIDAVKAKVAQADALWGQGNRDGAVKLYRQVVAEIGTGHFLGQRASARIAQAQREMQ